MSASPSVAIVMPTYGAVRLPMLRRTLSSLGSADWPPEVAGLWLVENGPRVGAAEVCAEFNGQFPIHYLHEPKLGLSAARNAGAKVAQGEFLIFLDNDIRLARHTLTAYVEAFRRFGPECCFGGPLQVDLEQPPADWLRPYLPWSVTGMCLGEETRVIDQPLFSGGNHAISRQMFERVGFFDPVGATGAFGGVGEETRLQERVKQARGQLVYVAQAVVWHYVAAAECSPRWALQREFRHAFTDATTSPPTGRVDVARVPLWVWRRWLGAALRTLAARVARRSMQSRFGTEHDRAHWAGVIAGCRQRRSDRAA